MLVNSRYLDFWTNETLHSRVSIVVQLSFLLLFNNNNYPNNYIENRLVRLSTLGIETEESAIEKN